MCGKKMFSYAQKSMHLHAARRKTAATEKKKSQKQSVGRVTDQCEWSNTFPETSGTSPLQRTVFSAGKAIDICNHRVAKGEAGTLFSSITRTSYQSSWSKRALENGQFVLLYSCAFSAQECGMTVGCVTLLIRLCAHLYFSSRLPSQKNSHATCYLVGMGVA